MSANEVRAGRAFVEVYTKDNTQAGLSGIKSKLASFGSTMAKVGGIALGAAASGIAASVIKTVTTGAGIDDLAKRYGMNTDAVQELGFAAKQSGTDLDVVIKGIRAMQVGIGNGKLGDELAKIGVSLDAIKGKSPQTQFETIAEAVGQLGSQEEKIAAATAIFGKSASELMPMLQGGKDGVKALTAEFRDMGAVMSEDAVKQAAALDDELGKLGTQFNALIVALGTRFLPIIHEITANLKKAIPKDQVEPDRGPGHWAADGRWVAQAQFNTMPSARLLELQNAVRRRLDADIAKAEARERSAKFRDAMSAVRDVFGLRSRDLAARNLTALPGNTLNAIYGYLAGSPIKAVEQMRADMASFGTFDARDIAGGGFLQATNQQLEELRKQTRVLEEIKNKKPGVPWG